MAAAAITTAVVGAASVAAGAVSASKTRKSNEKLAKRAELNEKNRRERAAEEIEKATQRYNEIRKERPGFTVREFLSERLEGLTGPEADKAREEFNQLTEDDFRSSQFFADQASIGNINTFDLALDAVSGGTAVKQLEQRNKVALEQDPASAFSRALELGSTAIPAGTVQRDSNGNFVRGQRSDKQIFNLAFETQEQLRDKQFSKLSSNIDADRQIALRQQEKAQDFLNQNTAFGQFANTVAGQARAERIGFQTQDEATQLRAIENFQNAAFSDQTAQPTFHQDNTSAALIQGGFDLALKGLGQNKANSS